MMLASCSTVRPIPVQDSTRVEVWTETVIRKDTVFVELPVIIEKRTTLDTTSRLENKYAISEASVSGGILAHSLSTKPVREPVTIETKEIVRDSIVYRDRIQTVTVEVEKKLTVWQSFKIKAGGAAILLIAFAILYLMFNLLNLFRP